MTDIIRPGARALLRRWSEPVLSLCIAGAGLYWSVTGLGMVRWLGWVVTALGLALLWSAVQRARFSARGEGPGVVQIIEGEIRYFGPRGGGFAAIDAIDTLSLSADGAFWLVEAADAEVLAIPRAAAGHEGLFDAFASLPGLDMAHLLHEIAQPPKTHARPIWTRHARRPLT